MQINKQCIQLHHRPMSLSTLFANLEDQWFDEVSAEYKCMHVNFWRQRILKFIKLKTSYMITIQDSPCDLSMVFLLHHSIHQTNCNPNSDLVSMHFGSFLGGDSSIGSFTSWESWGTVCRFRFEEPSSSSSMPSAEPSLEKLGSRS